MRISSIPQIHFTEAGRAVASATEQDFAAGAASTSPKTLARSPDPAAQVEAAHLAMTRASLRAEEARLAGAAQGVVFLQRLIDDVAARGPGDSAHDKGVMQTLTDAIDGAGAQMEAGRQRILELRKALASFEA